MGVRDLFGNAVQVANDTVVRFIANRFKVIDRADSSVTLMEFDDSSGGMTLRRAVAAGASDPILTLSDTPTTGDGYTSLLLTADGATASDYTEIVLKSGGSERWIVGQGTGDKFYIHNKADNLNVIDVNPVNNGVTINGGTLADFGALGLTGTIGGSLDFYEDNGSTYTGSIFTASNAGSAPILCTANNNVFIASDAGFGYFAGIGGSVTQDTSITTTVIVNDPCGTITTVTAPSIGAGAEAEFTVTNSSVAAVDCIIVTMKQQFTDGVVIPYVKSVAAGSFVLGLTNVGSAAVSAGTAKINFAIIKSDD